MFKFNDIFLDDILFGWIKTFQGQVAQGTNLHLLRASARDESPAEVSVSTDVTFDFQWLNPFF